jgi:hypothetical protein
MHAISITVPGEQNLPILDDPYFEDQAYAEAGFAFEYVVSTVAANPNNLSDAYRSMVALQNLSWMQMGACPSDTGSKRIGRL